MANKLSREQIEAILGEVAHYLAIGAYDFIVHVGNVTIIGEEYDTTTEEKRNEVGS